MQTTQPSKKFLMRLFSAQVRDQSESDAVEGQAVSAKRSVSVSDQALKAQSSVSDQTLKASDSVQISSDQPESEFKSPSSVQFSSRPLVLDQCTNIKQQ